MKVLYVYSMEPSILVVMQIYAKHSVFPDSGSWNQYSKVKLYLLDF